MISSTFNKIWQWLTLVFMAIITVLITLLKIKDKKISAMEVQKEQKENTELIEVLEANKKTNKDQKAINDIVSEPAKEKSTKPVKGKPIIFGLLILISISCYPKEHVVIKPTKVILQPMYVPKINMPIIFPCEQSGEIYCASFSDLEIIWYYIAAIEEANKKLNSQIEFYNSLE